MRRALCGLNDMVCVNWMNRMRALLPEEIRGIGAVLYDRLAAPGFLPFHRAVASQVSDHLTLGSVLDVGTGPGRLLVEINRCNPRLQLVGLDLSRTMLRIASAKSGAGETGRMQFVRGNVRRLPFRDACFDLVVSTASLHHWCDPQTGIRECFRVTSRGGECWIYDLRSDASPRVHAAAISGGRLRSAVLGVVFRFHGVMPAKFSGDMVAGWLRGADVEVQLDEAHVKLVIRKARCAVRSGLRTAVG